jgi:hypothetical protein
LAGKTCGSGRIRSESDYENKFFDDPAVAAYRKAQNSGKPISADVEAGFKSAVLNLADRVRRVYWRNGPDDYTLDKANEEYKNFNVDKALGYFHSLTDKPKASKDE